MRPVKYWTSTESVAPLIEVLDRGGVLAVPTGSSYGLAVDPTNADAVQRVFEIKRRPGGEPLPVVISSFQQLAVLGINPADGGVALLAAAGPGPLAVIVSTRLEVAASAGRGTLAVRRPAHTALLDLLDRLDRPLTATSANRSGDPPILTPGALEELLAGHDAMIVDGGELAGGEPSTLVQLGPEGVRILRQGRFDPTRLERLLAELEVSLAPRPGSVSATFRAAGRSR